MFDTEIHPADLGLLDLDSAEDQGLPADLESIPPGLLLAVILSSVDRDRLSGYDRVRVLKADARMVAHFQARLYADIQSVSDSVSELDYLDDPDSQVVFETASSEVQAALTLTRRSADIQLKQIRPGIYQWTSPLGHTYTTRPDQPSPDQSGAPDPHPSSGRPESVGHQIHPVRGHSNRVDLILEMG